MDVDTHIISIKKETSQGERDGHEDESDDVHGSEQHSYQEEEGGPICLMGQNTEGGWQTKGKSKEKAQHDGACYNCGKTGHRSGDCGSEGAKAKVNRRAKP